MTIEIVRDVLFWCFIINFGFMMYWFLMFMFAHDWVYRKHSKWFKVSVEQFDATIYALLGCFKLCVIMFNLVPWIALHIVG